MIRATEAERDVIERVLSARPELAMFPLFNLARHGIAGCLSRAMTFWLDDATTPEAILGLTDEGVVMPVMSETFDIERAVPMLADHHLIGLSGPASGVRRLMRAGRLTAAPDRLDADEPQFRLDLARFRVPGGPGSLAPISSASDIARLWRAAYLNELHMGRTEPDRIAEEVGEWISADSHRFLVVDGRPLALTDLNVRLPQIVRIGGVFTPPDTRGFGLARRAVARHLADAHRDGIANATLFAASAAAAVCYRSLGFERIGDYALVFLAEGLP